MVKSRSGLCKKQIPKYWRNFSLFSIRAFYCILLHFFLLAQINTKQLLILFSCFSRCNMDKYFIRHFFRRHFSEEVSVLFLHFSFVVELVVRADEKIQSLREKCGKVILGKVQFRKLCSYL